MKQLNNVVTKFAVQFKNTLVGILVGVANIIPGISGGTILALANLYEKTIQDFATIIKFNIKTSEWRKSLFNVVKLLLGIAIGLILFSHMMSWLLENAFRATLIGILVFMIISFVQYSVKFKPDYKKHIILFTIGLLLPVGISYASFKGVELNFMQGGIGLFVSGVISTFAMIVPGISGSMILLIIGTYDAFVNTIKELDITNLLILGSGVIIGAVGAIIGVSRLYKTRKAQMEVLICGLLASSLFALIISIYQGGK